MFCSFFCETDDPLSASTESVISAIVDQANQSVRAVASGDDSEVGPNTLDYPYILLMHSLCNR